MATSRIVVNVSSDKLNASEIQHFVDFAVRQMAVRLAAEDSPLCARYGIVDDLQIVTMPLPEPPVTEQIDTSLTAPILEAMSLALMNHDFERTPAKEVAFVERGSPHFHSLWAFENEHCRWEVFMYDEGSWEMMYLSPLGSDFRPGGGGTGLDSLEAHLSRIDGEVRRLV